MFEIVTYGAAVIFKLERLSGISQQICYSMAYIWLLMKYFVQKINTFKMNFEQNEFMTDNFR